MPVKVVYICGEGRSGSTLLDRILGSLDGVSSFNEVYEVWRQGEIPNVLCSCGKEFSKCPVWEAVTRDVRSKHGSIERILRLQDEVDHSRYFLRLWTNVYSQKFEEKLNRHKEILRTLYFSLAEHSGCDVLVDSSKVPSRALILNDIPGIEVCVLHVVRDVRGVINSWKKVKFDPAFGGNLPTFAAHRTIAGWTVRNILTEFLAARMPYTRAVYEDWTRQPRTCLQKIVDALPPLAGKFLPFENDHSIVLGPIHSVCGNPDRFKCGPTNISSDEKWKHELGSKSQRLAKAFAFPLLWRYGYIR